MLVVSPLPQCPLPVGDIPTYVFGAAAQHWDRVALVDGGSGLQLTASDIYQTAMRLAAGLVRAGYGGRVVSTFADSELQCVYVYFAALMAGGTYQSLCPGLPADAVRCCVERSQTPVVFTTAARLAQLRAAISGLDVAMFVLDGADECGSNGQPFAELLVDDPGFVPTRIITRSEAIAKPALLACRSGPHGNVLRPLALSHYGLLSWCRFAVPPALPPARPRTAVSAVPLAESGGIATLAQFPILTASCVVQLRSSDPATCLAALEQWQAESFFATHDVLAAIAAKARSPATGRIAIADTVYDVRALQAVYTRTLHAPRAFKDRVAALLGARLVELYGYAETGTIAGLITEHPRIEGSVGLLCPGVSARVVLAGNDVADGGFGEILVSTPRLLSATGDPEYFSTGDYGTVTADGVVVIRARMEDLVHLRAGSLAAPADVEPDRQAMQQQANHGSSPAQHG
ncbi:4-coumarate--CoA ligase [Coemansia spiralis]|nr:4-coumarate--CoA ligase [Coemansia spiralis]